MNYVVPFVLLLSVGMYAQTENDVKKTTCDAHICNDIDPIRYLNPHELTRFQL